MVVSNFKQGRTFRIRFPKKKEDTNFEIEIRNSRIQNRKPTKTDTKTRATGFQNPGVPYAQCFRRTGTYV